MTMNAQDLTGGRDFYRARLENGELIMEPFCACGNGLNEDYFCDRCRRKCRCDHVICKEQATLAVVREYIRKMSQFSGFTTSIATEP